jgi:hypothetical protein
MTKPEKTIADLKKLILSAKPDDLMDELKNATNFDPASVDKKVSYYGDFRDAVVETRVEAVGNNFSDEDLFFRTFGHAVAVMCRDKGLFEVIHAFNALMESVSGGVGPFNKANAMFALEVSEMLDRPRERQKNKLNKEDLMDLFDSRTDAVDRAFEDDAEQLKHFKILLGAACINLIPETKCANVIEAFKDISVLVGKRKTKKTDAQMDEATSNFLLEVCKALPNVLRASL